MKGDFMRQIVLIAGTFLWGASAFAADPQLMNFVMPDAKIMAGVNVTTAKLSHSVAFIGSSIVVAGDTTSVKAALDRNSGSNSIDPALAARVQALSTTEDAWSVSMASLASLLPPGPAATTNGQAAQVLQVVK